MDTDNPIEIAVGAVTDLLIELHNNKAINLDKVDKGKIVNDTNDRLVLKQKIIGMNVDRVVELEQQLKELVE